MLAFWGAVIQPTTGANCSVIAGAMGAHSCFPEGVTLRVCFRLSLGAFAGRAWAAAPLAPSPA